MSLIVPCQLFVAIYTSSFFYLSCLPNTYVILIFNILAHGQGGGYILWNVQLNNKLWMMDSIKGALTSSIMNAYLA
jgi:hypothetical protein